MNMRAASSSVSSKGTMVSAARKLIKREGIRGLWVGNGVNCIKDGPRSGITFLAYERFKSMFLNDPKKPNFSEKFMCGGLAGYTSMTLTYPLFVAQARIAVASKNTYTGLIDCLGKLMRQEGLKGLMRGYDAATLSVVPERGISLMVYMSLRDIMVQERRTPTVGQSLAFGAISSFVAQCATAPVQTVMVRLMTQGESLGRPVVYHNTLDCFRKIIYGSPSLKLHAEGYRSLYRGLPAHLLKMIPGTAIQFSAFEFFSDFVRPFTG